MASAAVAAPSQPESGDPQGSTLIFAAGVSGYERSNTSRILADGTITAREYRRLSRCFSKTSLAMPPSGKRSYQRTSVSGATRFRQ